MVNQDRFVGAALSVVYLLIVVSHRTAIGNQRNDLPDSSYRVIGHVFQLTAVGNVHTLCQNLWSYIIFQC